MICVGQVSAVSLQGGPQANLLLVMVLTRMSKANHSADKLSKLLPVHYLPTLLQASPITHSTGHLMTSPLGHF